MRASCGNRWRGERRQRWAVPPGERAEHLARGYRHARIDQDQPERGKIGDRGQGFADSRAMSGRAARHIGRSAPSCSPKRARSASPMSSFQSRASPRSAAAASLDPPPTPDATGRFFFSTIETGPLAPPQSRRRISRARSTRLVSSVGTLPANGPSTARLSSSADAKVSRSPKRVNTASVSIR